MTWEIRPAKRSEAKPLIGIYSESGCGKTWSSLMLARGFVGPTGKIVMLETEAGRGEVYADVLPGGYDICSLRNNFSPENYGEAISAIEKLSPDALIIDSASHEWEGSGGVLAMAAQNEAAGKKSMMVWQGPKQAHQRYFVLRLLATPIPFVIVCMRAKYPMKEVKVDGKKEWARSEQVVPVQSDGILYELMIHGWIDQAHRFQGTKYTRDDLKQIIKSGEPISIQTGERLAAWAKGGAHESRPAPASRPAPEVIDTRRAEPVEAGDQDTQDRPQETREGDGRASDPAVALRTRGALIAEVFELMNKANGNSQKKSAATLRAFSADFALPNETSNLSDFPDAALARIALMTPEGIKTFQRNAGLV